MPIRRQSKCDDTRRARVPMRAVSAGNSNTMHLNMEPILSQDYSSATRPRFHCGIWRATLLCLPLLYSWARTVMKQEKQ
jgi:hypothetical protein